MLGRYFQEKHGVLDEIDFNELVTTVNHSLAGMDARSVEKLRHLNRQLVLERLSKLGLRRTTLDFDGSALSTGRFAEATAVGFNRKWL